MTSLLELQFVGNCLYKLLDLHFDSCNEKFRNFAYCCKLFSIIDKVLASNDLMLKPYC